MGHTVLLFGGHQTNQAEIDKDLIFSAGSTGAAINIILLTPLLTQVSSMLHLEHLVFGQIKIYFAL